MSQHEEIKKLAMELHTAYKKIRDELSPVKGEMEKAAQEIDSLLGGTATKADRQTIAALDASGQSAENGVDHINTALKDLERFLKDW